MTSGSTGRLLYLDPWAGAAGDMLLAALLDLTPCELDLEAALREGVSALGLPGVSVDVRQYQEGGLRCRRVDVLSPSDPPARDAKDLVALVEASRLSPWVRERTEAALWRLARVEADLHGVPVADVHLHELGGLDTLVDVAGTFVLVEALAVDWIGHGAVPVGAGRVATAHGALGVPAPATLALLMGTAVLGGPEEVEVTTPTGALLLTELAHFTGPMPVMRPLAVGHGAGRRTLAHGPNLLRAVLGEGVESHDVDGAPSLTEDLGTLIGAATEPCVVLQASIDDATAEALGHLLSLLLEADALDAWCAPVVMKKSRPGTELTVLCRPADEAAVAELIFRESTTLGMRRTAVQRYVLERSWVTVEVQGRPVRVKLGSLAGQVVTVAAEWSDAAAASAALGRPAREVAELAAAAARSRLA